MSWDKSSCTQEMFLKIGGIVYNHWKRSSNWLCLFHYVALLGMVTMLLEYFSEVLGYVFS